MLSKADNDALCRVGRGTPMGELYRRFWTPVVLADEVGGPDSPPVKVRVLGEDLVAFRDTDGNVGLIDPYCPHRGANLFWGRNEECGIRCVYHGWKFDTTGKCVEMPNSPEGESYKDRVRVTAYPTWEKAGIIWAYLGPADKEPPKPGYPWLDLPQTHRYLKRFEIECNFIQAIDGDYDPSHAYFLHSTLDGNRTNRANSQQFTTSQGVFEGVTFFESEAEEMDYGLRFRTRRHTGAVRRVGTSHFILPSFTTAGIQGIGINANNIRVPKDDTHTSWFRLRWSFDPLPEAELNEYRYGGFIYPELVPGQPIPVENKSNNYLINRHLQKTYSYTGIKSFTIQDLAVQEDQWGPLADRSREHLVKSDEMIIRYRRFLLTLARDLEAGREPVAPWRPEAFYKTWNEIQVEQDEAMSESTRQAQAQPVRVPAAAQED
jgi:phenylpropionate dioxygenase-like ring-hydroxylating dioxygenase large terminal subunit